MKQKYIGLKIDNEDIPSTYEIHNLAVNNEDQYEVDASENIESESNDVNSELFSRIEFILLKEQLYLNAELDLMTFLAN